MKVFCHHVYEYKKGLRNLVLHTTRAEHREAIEAKLQADGIAYLVYPLGNGSINVFFGNPLCIEVLRRIDVGNLARLSDEEDFLLGIMLGYDRLQQCARFLKRETARRWRNWLADGPGSRAGHWPADRRQP